MQFADPFLRTLLVGAVLRYLAVAHFGRGRGQFIESEAPAFWQVEVEAALARREAELVPLWKAVRSAPDEAGAAQAVRALLEEIVTGTLERLMTMPLAKLDILVGYAIAFGAVAAVQAVLAAALGFGLLGLDSGHSAVLVAAVAVANGLLGMALGLFSSAFATTEFQAVQFMPAVVVPQILLCGLLVPRERLPDVLEAISDVLPLSYAVDAMESLVRSTSTGEAWADLAVIAAFTVAALALGAATLRRRTA